MTYTVAKPIPNPNFSSTFSLFSHFAADQSSDANRNINVAGNVSDKLRRIAGKNNVRQTANNQQNKNKYFNSVNKGSKRGIVDAETGNVQGGLQSAKGQNEVSQNQNNNENENNFTNLANSSNEAAHLTFAAGNTVGQGSQVSGAIAIHQSGNNGQNHNIFVNQ